MKHATAFTKKRFKYVILFKESSNLCLITYIQGMRYTLYCFFTYHFVRTRKEEFDVSASDIKFRMLNGNEITATNIEKQKEIQQVSARGKKEYLSRER